MIVLKQLFMTRSWNVAFLCSTDRLIGMERMNGKRVLNRLLERSERNFWRKSSRSIRWTALEWYICTIRSIWIIDYALLWLCNAALMKAGLFLYVLTETESALVMETMMPYLLILLPETTISVLFRLLVIEISAFIVWIKMLFPCIDVVKVEWGTCFISYRYVNVRLRGVFPLFILWHLLLAERELTLSVMLVELLWLLFPTFRSLIIEKRSLYFIFRRLKACFWIIYKK